MQKQKYGLPTAIAMLIGVVIGSGIFFKSDNILVYTGGSVGLGVLVFILAATAIVFGGLTVSELASRTDSPGGVVAYAKEFCSNRAACAMGWFQCLLYFPTLVVVVSWVGAIYTLLLFGIELPVEGQILLALVYILIFYGMSILSSKLAGVFQTASTVIKLLPLALFAIAGLLFGNPDPAVLQSSANTGSSLGWLAAVGPIAFSFDGWIVSTTISHELKDAKRNLPIVLITAPLFVLLCYIAYFVGISRLVGVDQIMAMGDAHVDYAADLLLGPMGAKVVLVFVIISVLGTVNGLVMGYSRLPGSLAQMGLFPRAGRSDDGQDQSAGVPGRSALVAMGITLIWVVLHYLCLKFDLLPNSDISEIAIVASYGTYLLLYWKVYDMGRKKQIRGFFKSKVFPLLATVGSGVVLLGGLQNPFFPFFLLACVAVMGVSQIYYCRRGTVE